VTWIKAVSLNELQRRPVVIKHAPKQIAVFSLHGSVYAIDNRCPHEGYPLAAGQLSNECVLTCNWHNWKFRLDTGECLIGGDDVRSYPTKIEGGHAWINIADPPAEESRGRILEGLKAAFDDRDFGRVCREIARLHYYGLDPVESVTAALGWAHDRFEFGTTHAIAGAADWLYLASRYRDDFETRLICLSEAVDHLADDSLRHPKYPYAEAGNKSFARGAFLAAVEDEVVPQVEGMVSRAVVDGLHWPDLEEAFTAAAFAHYNDFGHSVIYVSKTAELIDALGGGVERVLVLPLARHLCYTTREDLLPEFKDYAPTLSRLEATNSLPHSGDGPTVPFPAAITKAFEWLRTNFGNYGVAQLYDRLLEALALNLLYYDVSYDARCDGPVSQNVSWLDFTHGLTMANAARKLCSRYPQFWKPALAQMACFLGRNVDFIDRAVDPKAWAVTDASVFFRDVRERLFDHGLRDPIFSVHLLKTSLAVEEELEHASASCRQALLAGLNRFFKSPLKTKHVRRTARQAIQLVSRDFIRE
jgi:nitrite reductase/ring-hydroxylating ferredoxin subunit